MSIKSFISKIFKANEVESIKADISRQIAEQWLDYELAQAQVYVENLRAQLETATWLVYEVGELDQYDDAVALEKELRWFESKIKFGLKHRDAAIALYL